MCGGGVAVGVHDGQMQFRPVRITISAWPLSRERSFMRLSLFLLLLLHATSALQLTTNPVGRRAALRTGLASVLTLLPAGRAHSITDYAKSDFKDGLYVGPSVVGAAPTAEDEAKLEELYLEALKKQEKVVKDMGFDMDDDDKREVEMMIRNQYCGFQAKLKCKGSPAAKMNGGRY